MGSSSSSMTSTNKFIDSLTREECIDYLFHGYIRNISREIMENTPSELNELCIEFIGGAHNLGLISKKELTGYKDGNNQQIFVKLLTGKTITLDISENAPIYIIKYLIKRRENIPIDKQMLVYAGKQLQNEYTLAHYNYRDGITLHLIFDLRGKSKQAYKDVNRAFPF